MAASTEVSVICTAKNAAATIEGTITSILAQDFGDWEMIIVDDGSTDDTVSVVRRFALADPRIRLVPTTGIGRSRALNRAVAEAKADLVANIDADDEGHPSWLRCSLRAMQRHPQFAIMSTEWIRIYDSAAPRWQDIDDSRSFEVADVTKSLALYNPIYHSSVMMRKAAIVALGGYDESLRAVIDYDLWVRSANAGLRLGRITASLVAQRVHPGQSYMHAPRLRYLLTGARVQVRAMRSRGVVVRYLPLLVLRLLWALLPLRARLVSNDLWGSWRGR